MLLAGVLSRADAAAARGVAVGYVRALAAGSCVAVSCPYFTVPGDGERIARMWALAGTPWHNHGPADVASFFGGLSAPGRRRGPVQVGDADRWPMVGDGAGKRAYVLGGAGIRRRGR